jgi:hypothetical protein
MAGVRRREKMVAARWRENNEGEAKAGTLGIRDVFREDSALIMQIIGLQRAGRPTKHKFRLVYFLPADRPTSLFLLPPNSRLEPPSVDGQIS